MDEDGDVWIPMTCASCKERHLKREVHLKGAIKRGEFTGCCVECYRSNMRAPGLKTNGSFESDGYILRHQRTFTEDEWKIIEPMKRAGTSYIPEHRAVMALHLGRPLTSKESVHHLDGNGLNNDIANLFLHSLSSHSQLHREQLKTEIRLMAQVKELQKEVKRLGDLLDLNSIIY